MKMVKGLVLAVFLGCLPACAEFHAPPLNCNACHTMHNMGNGRSVTGGTPEDFLLKTLGGCRGCHDGSMLAAGAPDVFSAVSKCGTPKEAPSGSFFDMTKPGSQGNGHNPVSCGIPLDSVLGLIPPGNATSLTKYTCGSCHDPHGGPRSCNSYRLLRKKPGNYVGPDLEVTGIEGLIATGGAIVPQSATNHNVYKSGFSQWCAACHAQYLGSENTGIHNVAEGVSPWSKHPTDLKLTEEIGGNYGPVTDFRLPLLGSAYSSTITAEPRGGGKVFCLSCHRAHASEFLDGCRWNNQAGQTYDPDVVNCQRCHNKGG